jgi:AcrR family transcriptional regulator
MAAKVDNRQARGEATRRALMRAAEKLIAEHGIENVTIRLILEEADQRNTSALQYHFKNLKGLIGAIHAERAEEIRQARGTLLAELLEREPNPTLRDLCELMIRPAVDLASSRVDYRRYIKAFGHHLALEGSSALEQAGRRGGGGSSGMQLQVLLREKLKHLDDHAFRRRMELAVRLCATSVTHQARQPNAFRGKRSDLFIAGLIDALAGLLGAPESEQTRSIAARIDS